MGFKMNLHSDGNGVESITENPYIHTSAGLKKGKVK